MLTKRLHKEEVVHMRAAYLWLARLITLLVVVQAMSIAWAFFGVHQYLLKDGGTLDKAAIESNTLDFPGMTGFPIHAIVGERVLPIVALLLLIASFFAKVSQGVAIALVTFALIVVQIVVTKVGSADLGLFHGLNAFLIFGAAMAAAMKAKETPAAAGAAA
jgi:hypothetical protein